MNVVRALSIGLMISVSTPVALAQNYEYTGTSQPNLAQINVTRQLHADLTAYIANYTNAQNVGIAILDGRADPRHVDLQGRLTVSTVYSGVYKRYDNHGTHVAGIAGANQNGIGIVGVAPTAKLYSIPVFDDRGWVASDLGKRALDRADSLGAKSVNMSYGPTAQGDVFLNGELNLFDDYLSSMVLVRAAGNSGVNSGNEYYAGDASTTLAHLLIVGSVNGSNRISSFSNRPGEACIASSSICAADDKMKNFFIVAPGESILSDLPNNYVGTMSGTSMAAPHVAGAAALVFQDAYNGNTFLTPAQVADILKRSATDLGTAGVDSVYGWGLLNVAAALGPVGPTTVATTSTVSPTSTTTTTTTNTARLSRSSAMGRSAAFEQVLNGMVVFDSYGRGFVMNNVALAAPRSTLAEEAVSSLGASLLMETDVQESEAGSLALFQSSDISAGFSGFSFSADGYSLSSGVGNAPAFFSQPAPGGLAAASRDLGAQFFTGAGEIGQSFASGFFSGADIAVTPSLTLSALYAHGSGEVLDSDSDWMDANAEDAPANDLVTLGAAFALGDGGTLGVSYGLLREEDAMLGIMSEGAFSLGEAARTQIAGLSYSRRLGEGLAFDAFAQLGLTGTTGTEDTIFSSVSDVWSTKMGMSLTGTGVLQPQDTLRLALVSPWRIVQGDVEAQVAVGREFDGTVNYETRRVSLAGDEMPLDVGLSYTVTAGMLSYGGSLWLRDGDVETVSLDEAVVSAGMSWRF